MSKNWRLSLLGSAFALTCAAAGAQPGSGGADRPGEEERPGPMWGRGMGPGMSGPGMMGPGTAGPSGMMARPGMGYPGMGYPGMGHHGMGYPGMMRHQGMMGHGAMGPHDMLGSHGMLGSQGMMGVEDPAWVERLGLDDAQRKQLRQILDGQRRQQWEVMGRMMEERIRLRDLLDADTPDPKAAGEAYGAIARLQQQLFEARIQTGNDVRKLLTPEQRESLDEFEQRRDGRRGPGWQRRGGPGTRP